MHYLKDLLMYETFIRILCHIIWKN